MKYKVTHTTTYEYADPVPMCQNEVHLTPRACPGQTVSGFRLAIRPTPSETGKRKDYFGNPVSYFTVNEAHRKLTIRSVSEVTVDPPPRAAADDSPAWEAVRDELQRVANREGLERYQYVFDSPHVTKNCELAEYTAKSFPPERPIVLALADLNKRIHADFTYDPHATTTTTPVDEVFRNRRGVCQDLAHVQIGCLRSLGLAARYVSGYLRTIPPEGTPRLVGADASHAWASVFCGTQGWIDADPTNNVLPTTDHITVAWGRDYGDVCPINGVFVGGGKHTMTVAVNVVPIA